MGLFRIIKNRFVSASSEFDFVFEDGNNLNSGWEWNPVHERGNCCES